MGDAVKLSVFASAAGIAVLAGFVSGVAAATLAPERAVHRFMAIAVSPDGARIATIEGDAPLSGGEPVVRALMLRSADGKTTAKVALPCGEVRECWPSSPTWAPDGQALTFALRKPGTHARSLYTVDASGQTLHEILAFNGTIGRLTYGPDGRLAMLAIAGANKETGATQPGAPITGDLAGAPLEQRIAILNGDKLQWASPENLFVYEYDWRKDGSGFVGTAAPGDGDNNWWVAKLYAFHAADASAQVIFSPDALHQIADPKVSPDGMRVAFISGIMSDFGSTGGDVYSLALSGGDPQDITPAFHASARALGWDCDGHLQAEILAGADEQFVDLGDGTKPATLKVLWSGQESLSGGELGVCSSRMTAFEHANFATPPEIEAGTIGHWHNVTKENERLTPPPVRTRSVTWKSDGADVQGWLLLPAHKNLGKLPLITIVHGGPAAASRPNYIGPGLNRDLLTRGYALFLPNPRGSYGQGEAFTAANVRDLGHGDLKDILAGIDAAERIAPIDDNRLGITGGSYGGFMTMWAVTQTNRFKAGVAAAGISDWISYYGENGIDEWMIPYFGKSAYDDPEIYGRLSAISYIKNVKTPVFSYVGAQDIECPAPQTQEFWHALHDLGVPASYAIYPGEGHGLRDPEHIADAKTRSIAWFDKYLK